jgi:hypothetical protein
MTRVTPDPVNMIGLLGMGSQLASVCLTLSCLSEAEYDLCKFNVLFKNILERWPMLDFCTTILVYFESLILFFIKVVGK